MTTTIRDYRRMLARYLRPQAARVAVLAALLVGGIAIQIVNPQIMKSFVDRVTSARQRPVVRLALLFIAASIVQQLLAIAATWFGERVGWTATNELRADLMEHCLDMDP